MEKLLESLGIWRAKKSTNPVSVKQAVQRVFATILFEQIFVYFEDVAVHVSVKVKVTP